MSSPVRKLLALLVLLGVRVGSLTSVKVKQGETMSKIRSYEKLRNDIITRPVAAHKIPPDLFQDGNSSYQLSFRVWLVDIFDINDINQVMTVNLFIVIEWVHEGLSWNSSSYDDIKSVFIETSRIWTPNILVVMGTKDSFILDLAETLEVTSHGEVISSRHNYLTFSCSIDFMKYPFDIQTCSVGFFPSGNNSTPEIVVKDIHDYPLSNYGAVSGEWLFDRVSHDIVKTVTGWSNIPRYNFTMRRQRTYYVITFIVPVTLTSFMIPLAFLIPVQTGEKIPYVIAVFTSTAIFLNYISDVMPRSLSSMPYLAMFLFEILIEGFLALLGSLLVTNIYLLEKVGTENSMNFCNSHFQSTKDEKPLKLPPSILIPPSKCVFHITSRRLDMIFFLSFAFGQGLFLWIMFGVCDWL